MVLPASGCDPSSRRENGGGHRGIGEVHGKKPDWRQPQESSHCQTALFRPPEPGLATAGWRPPQDLVLHRSSPERRTATTLRRPWTWIASFLKVSGAQASRLPADPCTRVARRPLIGCSPVASKRVGFRATKGSTMPLCASLSLRGQLPVTASRGLHKKVVGLEADRGWIQEADRKPSCYRGATDDSSFLPESHWLREAQCPRPAGVGRAIRAARTATSQPRAPSQRGRLGGRGSGRPDPRC